MLMKKLSEDHYIIMDDSEINIGDIVAEKLLTGKYDLFTIHTLNDIDKQRQKKIAYSTQPESLGTGWMQSVLPLFLSEVKELIGEVDVEKKMISPYPVNTQNNVDWCNGYQRGYNQALEDKKERKYTEEDMRKMWKFGYNERNLDDSIESFQPQTEWEVEFVNGKLKLKQ